MLCPNLPRFALETSLACLLRSSPLHLVNFFKPAHYSFRHKKKIPAKGETQMCVEMDEWKQVGRLKQWHFFDRTEK